MGSDHPARGIALMVAGCLFLTINDAIAKLATAQVAPGPFICLRGGMVALLVVLWTAASRRGWPPWRIRDVRGQALRSGLLAANTAVFVFGLGMLPFAVAVTLGFANPLFVTALAPLFLGETVGWRRWAAVTAGFLGVAIIMDPLSGAWSWAMALPLIAALVGAVRDLLTRRMSATESSSSLVFYGAVAVAALGAVIAGGSWESLPPAALGLIAGSATAQAGALALMTESLRSAPAVTVAPFKYTILLWVVLLDLALWGRLPAWNVIAGSIVIVAAILHILYRERRTAPRRRRGANAPVIGSPPA